MRNPMNWRFTAAILTVCVALGLLITSAVRESKREIVTVSKLVAENKAKKGIQLGAKVAEIPFDYQTEPELLLKFAVKDIQNKDDARTIPVVFHGPMPETLRAGRDVILEGSFDGTVFLATQLQTQCPSKYEPPKGP